MISLACVLLYASCNSTSLSDRCESSCKPISASRSLPKVEVPTKTLLILDLQHDEIEGQVAACALQGLINRYSEDKIYVMNTICNDNHGGWMGSKGGRSPQAHMGEFWLRETLGDITQKRFELDTCIVNPGFNALVSHAKNLIKGVVIWDPQLEEATIEAATTIAAQKDGIIVSPEMARQIADYRFPIIEDLRDRFKSNIECVDWLVENYFDTANHQVAFTWSHMTTDAATTWGGANKDYVVANKLFTYFLDIQRNEECHHYETIVKRYPEGTPILGWTDELKADKLFADYGYFMIPYISVENMSVMSSFPSVEGKRATPQVFAVDKDDVFIAMLISDGDNLLHSLVYEPYTIYNSQYTDSVPTTWVLNPILVDLAPRVWRWYEQRMQMHELAGMVGDGSPISERFEGFSFYCDWCKHYLEKSGMRTMKQMIDGEAVAWRVQPYVVQGGYSGGRDWRGIDPHDLHMDNATFHIGTTSSNEEWLLKTIDSGAKGTPQFLCVFIGGSHYDAPKRMKEISEKLKNRNDGKNYHFVRCMDLAATYRAWKGLPIE